MPKHVPFRASAASSIKRPCIIRRPWPSQLRGFQSQPAVTSDIPDYAFAFDIDGVLMRSTNPIPGASAALSSLQKQRIPFILLTNGGGRTEAERAAELSAKLDVPLDADTVIQCHTPFGEMKELHDKTVLVVGGDSDRCRTAAQAYGFRHVVVPGDIFAACPDIWPFSRIFRDYYACFAHPLPKPIAPADPANSLTIDAMFVYNDPRDWALDSTILLDLLLSRGGVLGTRSAKNGDPALPNRGYQQDGQPPLYYSHNDLWWAAAFALPRLGQGGFTAAFDGLWDAVTGGGVPLRRHEFGKPTQRTFAFAERRLAARRAAPLRTVYMIGDNPASDIRGANDYRSPHGTAWTSILVHTGVHQPGTQPAYAPRVVVDDVARAVEWAMHDAKQKS